MKIWPIFYIVAMFFNAFDGYYCLLPENSQMRGVGWIELGITFVVLVLGPVWIIHLLDRSLRPIYYDRPSWKLPPYKPLQMIRFLVGLGVSAAVGAMFALPFTNSSGYMNFCIDCAIAVAVVLGEHKAHQAYQHKISPYPVP